MKNKAAAITLGLVLAAAFAGCQGVKKSTDNATVDNGLHYDSAGKLVAGPEVSVPLWSSKKLKEKPKDVTPVKAPAQ